MLLVSLPKVFFFAGVSVQEQKRNRETKTERERAMICNIMSNERWRMIRGRFGRQQHPLNGNTTIIRETTIHNWVFLVYFDSWIVGG